MPYDPEELESHLKVAAVSLSIIAALVGLWFKLRETVKRWMRKLYGMTPLAILDALEEIKTEQTRQGGLIDSIQGELDANGLGSVKDLVVLMGDGFLESLMGSDEARFICDSKGDNRYVSKGYLDMVGVATADELKAHSWETFLHPEDSEDYCREWKDAFADKRRLITVKRWLNVRGEDMGNRLVNARPVGNFYVGTITPA